MRNGPVLLLVGQFFRPRRSQAQTPEEKPPPLVQFRDTSYVPPPPRRRSRSFIPGLLISILGLVLAVAALFLPWYSYTVSGKALVGGVDYDIYERADYSFNNVTVDSETSAAGFTLSNSTSMSWGDYSTGYTQAYGGSPSLPAVYFDTLLVLLVAVTLGAVGVLLTFVFVQLRKRPLLPFLVLLVGATLLLVSAAVFGAWHPSAVKSDRSGLPSPSYAGKPTTGPYDSFFGSTTLLKFKYDWGPAAGWYLSIAAAAVMMLGATLLYGSVRKAEE